jgi:hypothetical protein
MHPVARVSIKYWNNLRTQHSIFSARFNCALITLHVSAPFGGHLQLVHKHKKYIFKVVTIYLTDPLSRHVYANIVVMQHITADKGRQIQDIKKSFTAVFNI